MKKIILTALVASSLMLSCKKDPKSTESSEPKLIMYFDFDTTMPRLDNFGNPVAVAAGNAAQHPRMNYMTAHWVELTPNALTQVGNGDVIYISDETTAGGDNAIDFQKTHLRKNGESFVEIPLKEVKPGTYKFLRVSIGYQNYDIKYHIDTTINAGGQNYTINQDNWGTIASFVGFNSYITSYKVKSNTDAVNGNKKQGYWAFETVLDVLGTQYPYMTRGQVPTGGTTVVNPLHLTSPIPVGACIVTGDYENGPLVITGQENKDVKVKVKVSINNSFEWKDINQNGKFDPLKGENAVDMGVRGIKGVIE